MEGYKCPLLKLFEVSIVLLIKVCYSHLLRTYLLIGMLFNTHCASSNNTLPVGFSVFILEKRWSFINRSRLCKVIYPLIIVTVYGAERGVQCSCVVATSSLSSYQFDKLFLFAFFLHYHLLVSRVHFIYRFFLFGLILPWFFFIFLFLIFFWNLTFKF